MRAIDADKITYFNAYGNLIAYKVDIDRLPTLTPPNEPLTLEQLREMDAPVWCVCKSIGGENGGKNGYWCLCRYGYITSPGGTFLEIGEIPHWPFYRRPPEGEA